MDEPMMKMSDSIIDEIATEASFIAWDWASTHGQADPDDEDRYITATDDVRMAIKSALKGVLV